MKPAAPLGSRLVSVAVAAALFLLASLAGGLVSSVGQDWLVRLGIPPLALPAAVAAVIVACLVGWRWRRGRRRPRA